MKVSIYYIIHIICRIQHITREDFKIHTFTVSTDKM